MPALHQREPGLAGLMGHEPYRPYYSVIADGVHLHASVLRMALRTDPGRCILITDSVELAGLPDGVYPGNGQVTSRQRKVGARVTMVNEDGEGGAGEEVLIGSAITLDQCVRNMVVMTACSLAEAIRCVTENVAGMMGESRRGVLEVGRWADFVVLDQNVDDGERVFEVKETWVKGVKIYDCDEEGVNRR